MFYMVPQLGTPGHRILLAEQADRQDSDKRMRGPLGVFYHVESYDMLEGDISSFIPLYQDAINGLRTAASGQT